MTNTNPAASQPKTLEGVISVSGTNQIIVKDMEKREDHHFWHAFLNKSINLANLLHLKHSHTNNETITSQEKGRLDRWYKKDELEEGLKVESGYRKFKDTVTNDPVEIVNSYKALETKLKTLYTREIDLIRIHFSEAEQSEKIAYLKKTFSVINAGALCALEVKYRRDYLIPNSEAQRLEREQMEQTRPEEKRRTGKSVLI